MQGAPQELRDFLHMLQDEDKHATFISGWYAPRRLDPISLRASGSCDQLPKFWPVPDSAAQARRRRVLWA